MKVFNYLIRIAELIARSIAKDTNSEEQAELDRWLLESKENKDLYSRICNYGNLEKRNKEYASIKVSERWEKVHSSITRRKRRIYFYKIAKLAAIFILPLLGALIFLLTNDFTKQEQVQQVSYIEPGTSKAVLILDDGRSYELDTAKKLAIVEKGGAMIENSENGLIYKELSNDTIKPDHGIKSLSFNEIRIPRGGEYKFQLSDGTMVYLNSMTSIKYPVLFSGNTREIELSGEAYFDVAHNPSKPFIVKSKHLNIEVLGTSFNVSSYDDNSFVETTLVEGKVRITDENGERGSGWVLKPSYQARFDKQKKIMDINKVNIAVYTSWKDGYFVFQDERLEDIMVILSRWYNIDISFDNPSIKEIMFGGRVNRYENIEPILDIITSTEKVDVEISTDKIVFKER